MHPEEAEESNRASRHTNWDEDEHRAEGDENEWRHVIVCQRQLREHKINWYGYVRCREKDHWLKKTCRTACLWEEKNRKTKKTEGQCKDRHGVEGLKEEHVNKWHDADTPGWPPREGLWNRSRIWCPPDPLHYSRWRVGENGRVGIGGEENREERRDRRHGIDCSSSSTTAHSATLGTCCVTADCSSWLRLQALVDKWMVTN